VNKPFLPLAAQRMSGRMAWTLVLGACAMGLAITKLFFRLVLCVYY
jgi:4-hydroxybenzoate polyprenyltransferase